MRQAMRTSPAAFAEGLNSWLHAVPGEVEAATAAAELIAEVVTLVAQSLTDNKWGGP
jgi:hypothetical protein